MNRSTSTYRPTPAIAIPCSIKPFYTFTGKERDGETGYGYFGERYMDHELKLAGKVLDYFYTTGLYIGKHNNDGTWNVSRSRITEDQYVNYKSVLNGLDFNGFDRSEQSQYHAKCEQ